MVPKSDNDSISKIKAVPKLISNEKTEWPIQSATSLDSRSLLVGENYARALGRTSDESMTFQEYVYDLCQKELEPGPLSRWGRFYSKSLEIKGRDSIFVKEAVWLRWSAGPLEMVALIAAENYAEALGSKSDESLLFQDEVYNRCQEKQTDCGAEAFGYWCRYYSKSLEARARDSTFVKRAAWEKYSATSLIRSLFSGEIYACALGRTSPQSLSFHHQVWERCLEEAEADAYAWGHFYSISLKEAGVSSAFVDDNPLSKPSFRGPPPPPSRH